MLLKFILLSPSRGGDVIGGDILKKILCFLILPVAFILTRIPLLKEASQIISFGLFIAVNFAVSLLFYFILKKAEFTLPRAILTAVFLFVVDQLIKIIIYKFDFSIELVGYFLRIEPTKNLNQTAMFNFLNLELNGTFIIIFKAVLVLVLFCIFIKLKNKSAYIWCAFVLLFSAGISNLADSVAWGYTLDYVFFSRLTCYDLKDFYVDTAIGFGLIEILFNRKKLDTIQE